MWFVFATCLVGINLVIASYWHPVQVPYVGDVIKTKVEEIKFCDKNVCVVDASRMALWMDENANPCDNFYRYVCGSMLRYQALNERYPYQGLQQILYETINEQRRKVLADPIRPDEILPHKIAKSMFQQCVDSRNVQKQSRHDFLNFMKSLGGFPMIEGSAWNSANFNRSRLFADFPTLMMDFFQLALTVLEDGAGINYVIAHNKLWYNAVNIDIFSNAFKHVLNELGIKYSSEIAEQHDEVIDWMRTLNSENDAVERQEMVSISTFNDFMNSNLSKHHIDWKQTLSSLLDFEVNDDFAIFVRSSTSLRHRIKLLDATSDRVYVNFFFMRLLVEYLETLSLYYLTQTAVNLGIQRGPQRFELCVTWVRRNMPVAFSSLLVRKYTNKQMIDDAKEIANRTMELITEIVKNDDSIPTEHRMILLEKLKSVKLILGYPDELLEDGNVEKVYESLTLSGNETFFEIFLQTSMFETKRKFKRFVKLDGGKLIRNESTKWTDYTTEDEYVTPLYVINQKNTIYYPSLWFQAPYFDPDRPRYYKDTMFAVFLAYTVNAGLKQYMTMNSIPSKNGRKNHFDFISAIYEKYAEWDDSHHEDPPLPGFLFSNKQLFWFTLIHKNCIKLQLGFLDDFNDERNAEAYFQETKVFQEAFDCKLPEKNLTSDELYSFYKRYNEFY